MSMWAFLFLSVTRPVVCSTQNTFMMVAAVKTSFGKRSTLEVGVSWIHQMKIPPPGRDNEVRQRWFGLWLFISTGRLLFWCFQRNRISNGHTVRIKKEEVDWYGLKPGFSLDMLDFTGYKNLLDGVLGQWLFWSFLLVLDLLSINFWIQNYSGGGCWTRAELTNLQPMVIYILTRKEPKSVA